MAKKLTEIIKYKCPNLVVGFTESTDFKPNADVLVKVENYKPTEIICPEYKNKKCGYNSNKCILYQGFKKLE
jgi:hypothetical protein